MTQAIAIPEPVKAELTKDTGELIIAARALAIRNDEDFRRADEGRALCVAFEKKIKASCDPIVDFTNKAHKSATTQRNEFLAEVVEAKGLYGRKMADYQAEQEKAQRLLRQEEEDRIAAEKAKNIEAAKEMEEAGNFPAAKVILQDNFDLKVNLPSAAPKLAGTYFVDVWKWEVTNLDEVPRMYFMLNEQMLNGTVKSLKANANIPGIRVFMEKADRSKGAR